MKKISLLIIVLINTIILTAQVNLSAGLVAYYPFNGNANDESGNGNNPIFNNATLASDRNGNPKAAYAFNGNNQCMRIKNSRFVNFSGAFSISVWVKVNGFYQGKCHGNRIIMKGDVEYQEGNYFLTYDDNYYSKGNNCFADAVDEKHQTFYGPYTSQLTGTEYVSPGKWNLLTFVYDGTTAKIYVNCNLYGHGKKTGHHFTNSDDLFFGRLNNPQYPYWFNGTMDEVRMYNRALSAAEVLALCEKKDSAINKEPVIDFTYTIANCNQVNFKITTAENIKSFRWELGDKKVAGVRSISNLYKTGGTYTVKLVATGTNGKEIIASKTFTIATPVAAFTTEKTMDNNTLKFFIENKQKLQYHWFFGDGEISSKEKNITHIYKAPGNYEAGLIAENKAGCRDTATKLIVIAPTVFKDSIPNTFTSIIPQADTAARLPEQRQNNLLKEIAVTGDSLSVSFYDNAEIDGDSVTIVYNNKIMVTHLFLTDKPRTFMLAVDKTIPQNELIMYAENLGSIPPNTALMIVYDGNQRHEVSISSSKTSNGMVSFIFKR